MTTNKIVNSTGPNVGSYVKSIGGNTSWYGTENVSINDDTHSQILLSSDATRNGYLVVTNPFDVISIPDDAIIQTISVTINLYSNTTRSFEDVYWSFLGLQTTSDSPGVTKNCANFVTIIPSNKESLSYTVAAYSANDWGFPYMVGRDITNIDFGLVLRLRSSNAPVTAFIDYISFISTWIEP